MKLICNTIYVVTLLATNSFVYAADMMPTYEATYDVFRDQKPTAEQHTKLSLDSNNQYTLIDHTKGTHGLASFTGFERNEKSQFYASDNDVKVNSHVMKQEVAFSKKFYQFSSESNSNLITGKHKKKFEITTDQKPISSHMLPIRLSTLVCDGKTNLTIPVLKSKSIRTYQFVAKIVENQLIQVDRVYPEDKQKSSQIWFDTKRHCIPIKTRHQESDEPLIETKLKSIKFNTTESTSHVKK